VAPRALRWQQWDASDSCPARRKKGKTGQKSRTLRIFFPFIGFCLSLLVERSATFFGGAKKKSVSRKEKRCEKSFVYLRKYAVGNYYYTLLQTI
jgi:hypothetical protein